MESITLALIGLGRPSGHLGGHNLEFDVSEVRTISGAVEVFIVLDSSVGRIYFSAGA